MNSRFLPLLARHHSESNQMASRPSRRVAPVDFGIACWAPEEHEQSGDLSVAKSNGERALFAAIDGVGHGKSAAAAARTAAAILESSIEEPLALVSLIQRCHEALRGTRGVVLSVAA